jgi:hypothetical protein
MRAFQTVISRSASVGTTAGGGKVALTTLKIVEFAPMPRASVTIANDHEARISAPGPDGVAQVGQQLVHRDTVLQVT